MIPSVLKILFVIEPETMIRTVESQADFEARRLSDS
jgi:hypothetical protein